jgi:hypothetical protein
MIEQFKRIPQELRDCRQWIVWRYEDAANGRKTKVPYKCGARDHADVSNPATWDTFEAACGAFAASTQGSNWKIDGIGFVFTRNDKFAGIDLDASLDPLVISLQTKIFETFASYSERSPSGKGLHIIIKADLLSGRRRNSVELYSSERFFTMTGDVFNDAPIADRQALAQTLWDEMGRVKKINGFNGTLEETEADEIVIAKATAAVNGDKFKKLHEGLWADLYGSQSEADFAYIDIIAYYTQARNQIVRIFRNSALGARAKALRSDYVEWMINRAFDNVLPPMDIQGYANGLDEFIARSRLGVAAQPQAAGLGTANPIGAAALQAVTCPAPSPYTIPPGMLGELAQFIHAAAPRQIPEVALAAAIGLMAGITGRAYNVSGMGLNSYILLLTQTGNGKEAMASGIDRLFATIKTEVSASREFRGPSEIASGQALLKYLGKGRTSFLSIIGEFGLKMQILADPRANAADKMLKRILLDLFNKSGNGRTIQPSVYSQKDNDTPEIIAPSVTILGESTPDTFYQSVNENVIADGLLPRFIIIEYDGKRPDLNHAHASAQPSKELREAFAALTANCLRLNQGINAEPLAIDVRFSNEAGAALNDFDNFATAQINSAESEIIRHLWNRAHVKALKLAALVAVGVNQFDPMITIEHADWAMRIVRHDVARIFKRFQSGDFGASTEETKQASEIRRVMREYVTLPFVKIEPYSHNPKMHEDKVVPYAYINKRLSAVAAFRQDRQGASTAMKRALQTLADSGLIGEVGKTQMQKDYDTSQRAFCVLDNRWLFNDN